MTTNKDQRRRPLLLFAAFSLIAMSLVAGLFSLGAFLEIAKLSRIKAWPSVDGTITASTANPGCRGMDAYTPQLEYRYVVNGNPYQGKRHDLGMAVCDTQARAEQMVLRYPVGAHVTVYFDPTRPADAVLETAVDTSALWLMGLATLLVSAYGFYWVLPRARILMQGRGGKPG